jgi:ATP-dependent DNA helicase PIF1
MRVVLCQNLDPSEGLVNGSQGTIVTFVTRDLDHLPRQRGGYSANGIEIRSIGGPLAVDKQPRIKTFAMNNTFNRGLYLWPVVKFDTGQVETIYPDCAVEEYGDPGAYSKLFRTQVPLMAGYALTIHKAQVSNNTRVRLW